MFKVRYMLFAIREISAYIVANECRLKTSGYPIFRCVIRYLFQRMTNNIVISISSSSASEIDLQMSFDMSSFEDSVNEGKQNIKLFRFKLL